MILNATTKKEITVSILSTILIALSQKKQLKLKNTRILSEKCWEKMSMYIPLPSKNILHNESRNKCISRETNKFWGPFPLFWLEFVGY